MLPVKHPAAGKQERRKVEAAAAKLADAVELAANTLKTAGYEVIQDADTPLEKLSRRTPYPANRSSSKMVYSRQAAAHGKTDEALISSFYPI